MERTSTEVLAECAKFTKRK